MRNCEECAYGGGYPEEPQIDLPCGHVFSVQTLDREFNMRAYYRYSNSGKIVAINVKDQPSESSPRCPTCTQSVHGVRRYAIVNKIMTLPYTLEITYAKLGRKLDLLEHMVSLKEKELDMGHKAFCKTLSTGTCPATNPRDTDLIMHRSNSLTEVQHDILSMRNDVAEPFEKSIAKLRNFFENQRRCPKVSLPFKLRFDSMWYRCRLIAFEDSLRVIKHLETMDHSVQHIPVLMQGLRMRVVDQTHGYIENLKALIKESSTLNLKRLEVEFRLLQLAIYLVARELSQAPDMDIKPSIARMAQLCIAFPDTAGKLQSYLSKLTNYYLRKAGPPSRIEECNRPPIKMLWQCWGRYTPGHLQYCSYGHPFSRQNFPSCPECGRELKVIAKDAKPHASAYASVRTNQANRNPKVRLPSLWSKPPQPAATLSVTTLATTEPSNTSAATSATTTADAPPQPSETAIATTSIVGV